MFLSQIKLDTTLRETTRALASPGVMHAIIERMFESSQRNLWRVDGESVLIVSTEPPTEPEAALQIGSLPATKDYDAFLSRLEQGRAYQFRLCANPVHSMKMPDGQRGKVAAHVTVEQQERWLATKAEKLGFTLGVFQVTKSEFVSFYKGGQFVTLKQATYDGVLTITAPEVFSKALTEGIGRGKAYGCGLLTIA